MVYGSNTTVLRNTFEHPGGWPNLGAPRGWNALFETKGL